MLVSSPSFPILAAILLLPLEPGKEDGASHELINNVRQQGIALCFMPMTIRDIIRLGKDGSLWRQTSTLLPGDPAYPASVATVGMFFKKTGCE